MKLDKEIIKYFKKWQQETGACPEIDIDKVDFEKVALSDERYFELNPKKSEIQQDLKDQNIEVSFIPLEKINPIVGKIDPQNTRNINDVLSGYTYFREGDVIFTKVTPSMENGNTAIAEKLVNGIGFGSSEYYIFRCKGFINKLLWHYLRTKFLRDQAKPTMTGSGGLKRVPKDFFSTVSILIPVSGDLDFQNAILKFIEYYKVKFDTYRQLTSALRSKIESFDKAFLPAIFSSEKESFIVEKFNSWAEERGYGLKFDEIDFFDGFPFDDELSVKLIGAKKLGKHEDLEVINDDNGLPVYDASHSILTYVAENRFPSLVFKALDESNPDISFASEGNSSAGTNLFIHQGKYFVNNHRTVLTFLDKKFYSKYVYYRLLNMKQEYGFQRGYIPSQSELKKLKIAISIPTGVDSFNIQKIIVEFIEHWQDWKAEVFKRINELESNINLTEEILIAKVFKGAEE